MDAPEYEGLVYINLSEENLKNQIINIKVKTYDYNISDYVYQYFVRLSG